MNTPAGENFYEKNYENFFFTKKKLFRKQHFFLTLAALTAEGSFLHKLPQGRLGGIHSSRRGDWLRHHCQPPALLRKKSSSTYPLQLC